MRKSEIVKKQKRTASEYWELAFKILIALIIVNLLFWINILAYKEVFGG